MASPHCSAAPPQRSLWGHATVKSPEWLGVRNNTEPTPRFRVVKQGSEAKKWKQGKRSLDSNIFKPPMGRQTANPAKHRSLKRGSSTSRSHPSNTPLAVQWPLKPPLHRLLLPSHRLSLLWAPGAEGPEPRATPELKVRSWPPTLKWVLVASLLGRSPVLGVQTLRS